MNADAEPFKPQPNPELKQKSLEPETVVEIIKDHRSISNTVDRSVVMLEASTLKANQNTQRDPSTVNIEDYNNGINAKCAGNLQKESEVKPPKKRGNYNNGKKISN